MRCLPGVMTEMHEQNSICSQKQLNDIAHEHTFISRQLFAGHEVGSRPMKSDPMKMAAINFQAPAALFILAVIMYTGRLNHTLPQDKVIDFGLNTFNVCRQGFSWDRIRGDSKNTS